MLAIEASLFQSAVLPCSMDGNPRENTSWSWSLRDTRNRSKILSSIERIEVGWKKIKLQELQNIVCDRYLMDKHLTKQSLKSINWKQMMILE